MVFKCPLGSSSSAEDEGKEENFAERVFVVTVSRNELAEWDGLWEWFLCEGCVFCVDYGMRISMTKKKPAGKFFVTLFFSHTRVGQKYHFCSHTFLFVVKLFFISSHTWVGHKI